MVYKKTPPNPLSGQRLRELLKEKGYTHEAFAEIIDVTPDYVGHMCQGKRAISPKRAKEFGDLLGVRPEYLLGVDDFRTHDLNWLKHSPSGEGKSKNFLRNVWSIGIIRYLKQIQAMSLTRTPRPTIKRRPELYQ